MFRKNRSVILQNNQTKKIDKSIKNRKLIKRLAIIASLFLLLLAGYGGVIHHVNSIENSKRAVFIQKKTSLIFFYKDDCKYCNKIFINVLAEKEMNKVNIQFVNLNSKYNHDRYKGEYLISAVPTFVLLNKDGKETERYVGSDMSKIQKLIDQVKEMKWDVK